MVTERKKYWQLAEKGFIITPLIFHDAYLNFGSDRTKKLISYGVEMSKETVRCIYNTPPTPTAGIDGSIIIVQPDPTVFGDPIFPGTFLLTADTYGLIGTNVEVVCHLRTLFREPHFKAMGLTSLTTFVSSPGGAGAYMKLFEKTKRPCLEVVDIDNHALITPGVGFAFGVGAAQ